MMGSTPLRHLARKEKKKKKVWLTFPLNNRKERIFNVKYIFHIK